MKQRKRTRLAIAAGAALACGVAGSATAQSADALLDKLVEKGILTSQEAQDIKAESSTNTGPAIAPRGGAPSWIKDVKFSGDFRLRLDSLWPEDGLKEADRLRIRMRLRYGAVWTPADWATIGVRLGTGDERSSGGDGSPNSNNQTFTHFFSKKPLFLDAAYVTLKPPGVDWISITGGKMNKILFEPGFNSPMVYDPDLTPEGAVEQFQYKFGGHDTFQAFVKAGEFVLDELPNSSSDPYLFDVQAGLAGTLIGDQKSPVLKGTVAGGYLTTENLRGVPSADGSGNHGNLTAGGNYVGDFNVVYFRGETAWKICDQPFLGTPALLTLGGEYDRNLSDTYRTHGDQTTGWTAQVMFGQLAKRGQWNLAYQYKHLEADAVLDSLTDDDFGGTDREGHVIKAFYNVRDWWSIGTTAFVTGKISNRSNAGHDQFGINGQQQVRLFVDTMFKF